MLGEKAWSNPYLPGDVLSVFCDDFYMKFLHLTLSDRRFEDVIEVLPKRLARILPFADDDILEIVHSVDWRGRLVSGVFVGILKKHSWLDRIGTELVLSRGPYAGVGLAFAMLRFGPAGVPYLQKYLRKWLPRTDCAYDQYWVMAALKLSDEIHGTNLSEEFMGAGGLWATSWSARRPLEDLEKKIHVLQHGLSFAELVLSLPPGKTPIPLRKIPSLPTQIIIDAQRQLIAMLYKLGINGQSRFFPLLYRFGRRGPLGFYRERYDEWVQRPAKRRGDGHPTRVCW